MRRQSATNPVKPQVLCAQGEGDPPHVVVATDAEAGVAGVSRGEALRVSVCRDAPAVQAWGTPWEPLMDAPLLHRGLLPDAVPIPLIEVALPDMRLTPNAAARALFPDLLTVGVAHPAVQALPALAAQMHTTGVSVVTREGQVGTTRCHQLLVALPERQALRVYLLDVALYLGRDALDAHVPQVDAIGQLADGVAHHVNNLLGVMLGYAGLLEEDLRRDPPAVEKVRAILHAGERTAVLIRQLVAFSHPPPLRPQVMQLHPLIHTLATRLRPVLGPTIPVTTRVDPSLGWVEADPHQVEQALMHLVDNAREAMPTGGHLTLETRNVEAPPPGGVAPGRYVVVAVRDTGGGMAAAIQAQMWEPFFTTKPGSQGTGLSLAMVSTTIRHSGGYLDVRSAVGQGTTVTVYLPRVPHVAPPPVASGTLRLPRGTETIVLVEAEPRGRLWARRTLEMCGYTVRDAGTGAEALDLIAQAGQPVHVLVTEVVLPDMRGAQLRARDAAVHVLYLADALEEGEAHAHSDMRGTVVPKPVAPGVLVRKVREMLDSESA